MCHAAHSQRLNKRTSEKALKRKHVTHPPSHAPQASSCGDSGPRRRPSHAPSRTLSALDYSVLHQASAPDLSAHFGAGAGLSGIPGPAASGQSFFAPGRYGGPRGRRASCGPVATAAVPGGALLQLSASAVQQQLLAVQRSPGSATALGGARAAARAVRRSPSMHARMRGLVQSAKERAMAPLPGSQEMLVTLR